MGKKGSFLEIKGTPKGSKQTLVQVAMGTRPLGKLKRTHRHEEGT